ncbi:MAG: type II toxin-antitoxin system YafQ family toxin [Terriglobia bacterium]
MTARNLIRGTQFRRDVKLAQRRGKDMSKLRELILLLGQGSPLPPRYKHHPLAGEWKHHRDCHLEPDWLLIYKIDGDDLYLVRTGTHSDLF